MPWYGNALRLTVPLARGIHRWPVFFIFCFAITNCWTNRWISVDRKYLNANNIIMTRNVIYPNKNYVTVTSCVGWCGGLFRLFWKQKDNEVSWIYSTSIYLSLCKIVYAKKFQLKMRATIYIFLICTQLYSYIVCICDTYVDTLLFFYFCFCANKHSVICPCLAFLGAN